jgi:transposase-like protein
MSQKTDKMAKEVIRYSDCFKRSAVELTEKEGMSIADCRRRYGIQRTATIQRWLRMYALKHCPCWA